MTTLLSVLILERNRKGSQETFWNKWVAFFFFFFFFWWHWNSSQAISSLSDIGFLDAGSWNGQSIFLPVSCFPFLLSSLREQVDGMTSKWSSPSLPPSKWYKWLDKTDWWGKSSKEISCRSYKQFPLNLQISSISCNLVWFISVLLLHDSKWMLFYFIFQYIEWSWCG